MGLGYVTINGEDFPLLYTLRVMGAMDERYNGIEHIGEALTAGEDRSLMSIVDECVWVLGQLLEGGRAYCLKNGLEARDLPTEEDIRDNFTIRELQTAIFDTLGRDSRRSIHAEPGKNAGATPESASS